jgi:hypothetical protein
MARYVISDGSPLIGLAMVDGLDWLPALFGSFYKWRTLLPSSALPKDMV